MNTLNQLVSMIISYVLVIGIMTYGIAYIIGGNKLGARLAKFYGRHISRLLRFMLRQSLKFLSFLGDQLWRFIRWVTPHAWRHTRIQSIRFWHWLRS